jgi:magnesium transporter
MIQEKKIGKLLWLDVTAPDTSELQLLVDRLELPQILVQSSLDPEHLPQLENENGWRSLVLRTFDHENSENLDTIQSITRKTAVLFKEDHLITLHRRPLGCIQNQFETANSASKVIPDLIAKMIKTYDVAIRNLYERFEEIEEEILEPTQPTRPTVIQDLYLLKRRVTLIKRILRMTQDPLTELSEFYRLHQARDYLEKYLFQLEEISDNLIGILSLQVSIAGQKSNEIMRVLTVYSIVFMPLNLIAGIYGMNFEHMPELKWIQGYPAALGLMITVAVSILIWFRRKGWVKRDQT